jgi:hypothetical protein
MKLGCLAITSLTAALALPGLAAADDAAAVHERKLGDITSSYQLQLAMDSAGPLMFKDTPDMKLEKTTAFEYGGRLAFFLGNERLDAHRFGIGVGYDVAARSDSRQLNMITPQLMYETGHPLILQLGLGLAMGNGTAGFASNYGGFATGATLRYSFLDKDKASPVSVSFGLTGKFVASTTSLQYSSAFVGGQIELVFHLGNQGGKK